LILAERGDRIKQSPAMADRRDAEITQIVGSPESEIRK
jgi:hypothetical protein